MDACSRKSLQTRKRRRYRILSAEGGVERNSRVGRLCQLSRLVDVGYDRHLRLKKYYPDKIWFTDGPININGIEAFWSFAKRRLAKFNGTTRNFELHIKECEWRWRKDPATLNRELLELLV